MKWVKPTFLKTRLVTVVKQGSEWQAVCSCQHFSKIGLCCRHVFSVTGSSPVKTDATVRWWTLFLVLCEEDTRKDINDALLKLRNQSVSLLGVPVSHPITWNLQQHVPQEHNSDVTKIMHESFIELKVRTDGTFWGTVRGQTLFKRVKTQLSSQNQSSSPFGLSQDTHLSNWLLQENEPMPLPDDEMSFNSSHSGESSYNQAETERRNRVKALLGKGKGAVYNSTNHIFSDILKLVTTVDEYDFMTGQLHELHKNLMKMAREREPDKGTSGEIMSHPISSSQKRNSGRLKKVTSPLKRAKKPP